MESEKYLLRLHVQASFIVCLSYRTYQMLSVCSSNPNACNKFVNMHNNCAASGGALGVSVRNIRDFKDRDL
jgi:AhpD family alkylhydroperoxidase